MTPPVFESWSDDLTRDWARAPVKAQHTLNAHPLFSMEALADLIDRYPREHYALVQMGEKGSARRTWREGDIGGLSGADVIDAIAKGRMWLNLRNVSRVDKRYRDLLERAFDEISSHVGGYKTFDMTSGILISSPDAQVYYHVDLPGQSLWQLHGRKRVYVYPNTAPFVTEQQLEHIALYEVEVDMAYDPSFDDSAAIYDIGPGEMLHWPLNAPHRVENLGVLNVSMTTEYWNDGIRRSQMINMANGILRDKAGMQPKSRQTSGPLFWTKAALQAGVKRSGLLTKERKARRSIDFKLDPQRPGAIINLAEPQD